MLRAGERVLEAAGRVEAHADPPHHRLGAGVALGRRRDDLGEAGVIEAEAQRGPRRLARVAEPPGRVREAPADLYGRREMRLERDRPGVARARRATRGSRSRTAR